MASLEEVTNQIKDTNKEQVATKEAVIALNNNFQKFFDGMTGGDALEDKLDEQRKKNLPGGSAGSRSGSPGSTDAGGGGLFDTFGKFLAGTFVGRSFLKLITPALTVMRFIKGNFFKLFKVGGVFYLIYEFFKDIKDNPLYKETIDSIKKTWTEKIVPLFNSIKASLDTIMKSEEMETAIESMKKAIGLLKSLFTNVKLTVQDWVLNTIVTLTDTISGVLEGIDLILKGEWIQGAKTIIMSLFNGAKKFLDDTLTGVLKLFGVDFGEDGTFLTWLGEKFDIMMAKVFNIWNNFRNGIVDGFNTVVSFFTETIPAKYESMKNTLLGHINNLIDFFVVDLPATITNVLNAIIIKAFAIYDSVVNAVAGVIDYITVDIPNKLVEVKNAIVEKAAGIYDSIVDRVTGVIDAVMSFIPTGEDIKRMLVSAVEALPGGSALLDFLGIKTDYTNIGATPPGFNPNVPKTAGDKSHLGTGNLLPIAQESASPLTARPTQEQTAAEIIRYLESRNSHPRSLDHLRGNGTNIGNVGDVNYVQNNQQGLVIPQEATASDTTSGGFVVIGGGGR